MAKRRRKGDVGPKTDIALRSQQGNYARLARPASAGESGASIHDEERGTHFRASVSMATGRVTPRRPRRPNRMDVIEAKNDLRSTGDIDVNQGSLFSDQEMDRLTLSDAEMSRRTGVPATPRSAGRGFLPGVGATARDEAEGIHSVAHARTFQRLAEAEGDKKAAKKYAGRAAVISKRKVEVINQLGKEIGPTTRTPEVTPGTPWASAIRNRLEYHDRADTPDWYDKGAPRAISQAAGRLGESFGTVRRATAHGSPQMPWDSGHAQDQTYRMNNVQFAEQMGEHVHKELAKNPDLTKEELGGSFAVPAIRGGVPHPTDTSQIQSLPQRIKTAESYMGVDTSQNIESNSQKVKNFDVALGAQQADSRWARRQALNAYTADTWDERTAGISSKYDFTGSTSRGGYESVAMTGRRGAMKADRLPSHFQELVWNARRGEEMAYPQQSLTRPTKGVEKVTKPGRSAGRGNIAMPGHVAVGDTPAVAPRAAQGPMKPEDMSEEQRAAYEAGRAVFRDRRQG